MGTSTSQPARVLLVGEQKMLFWGLQQLIDGQRPLMSVVGIALSDAEAIRLAQDATPNLILLDVDSYTGNWLELVPNLYSLCRGRLIALTAGEDEAVTDAVVLAGGHGVVSKTEPAERLVMALRKVHGGELWIDREAVGRVFHAMRNGGNDKSSGEQPHDLLTPGERKIVNALVRGSGAPNKVLASQLDISERTLRNHLTSIYQKLGLSNRLDLYVYALRHALVSDGGAPADPACIACPRRLRVRQAPPPKPTS